MDSQCPSDRDAAERAARLAPSIERTQQMNRRARASAAKSGAYRAAQDRPGKVPPPVVYQATIHIVLEDGREPVIIAYPGPPRPEAVDQRATPEGAPEKAPRTRRPTMDGTVTHIWQEPELPPEGFVLDGGVTYAWQRDLGDVVPPRDPTLPRRIPPQPQRGDGHESAGSE